MDSQIEDGKGVPDHRSVCGEHSGKAVKKREKKEEQLHAAGVKTVSVPDADGVWILGSSWNISKTGHRQRAFREGGGTLNDAALSADRKRDLRIYRTEDLRRCRCEDSVFRDRCGASGGSRDADAETGGDDRG